LEDGNLGSLAVPAGWDESGENNAWEEIDIMRSNAAVLRKVYAIEAVDIEWGAAPC
jgi:hypothetical protein